MPEKIVDVESVKDGTVPTPIPGVDPLADTEPRFKGGEEDLPPVDPQIGVATQ